MELSGCIGWLNKMRGPRYLIENFCFTCIEGYPKYIFKCPKCKHALRTHAKAWKEEMKVRY